MKISTLLAAVTMLVATACATSAPDDESLDENLGKTAQRLCPRGMDCFSEPLEPIVRYPIIKEPIVNDPVVTTDAGTGTDSGSSTGAVCGRTEGTSDTFTCPTKAGACGEPVLLCVEDTSSAVASTRCSCECNCSGSLFQVYAYNPCPSWAPTYSCTTYGWCTCQ